MSVSNKKIRVAFFAEILTEDHDGAVRTMYQLINRIDHQYFEFMFICGAGPDEIGDFEIVKVPAFTVPINRNYKMALPGLVQNSLKDKLQAFKPDVVHIATPALLGEFALKYAKQEELPVISIYHTHFISYVDYYLKSAPFLIDFVRTRIEEGQRMFYNQCNMIYMPSESIAGELTGIGISPLKMKIWKRGIDTKLFSPAKKNPDLMRRITGNNNPVILFASRLVWEKNLETLFKIYDGLKAEGIAFNMVMAGDGMAKKMCEERMEDAVFTGRLSHTVLAELYASADVFLFPSVSEAYGNVVLEAMASGLPCVIADGGGSADFIKQGVNGFKCEPYNEADYISRIKQLLNNTALHNSFVQAGLQYSKAFDWQQLADTYFGDLQQLAGHAQPELA